MPSGLGTLAGAAASVFGSVSQANSAKKAARVQAEAAAQANAEQAAARERARQTADQGLAYFQSFLPLSDAAGSLGRFYSANPAEQQAALLQYQDSPIGQLIAQNRQNAIERVSGANAAAGRYKSGGTIQDLARRTSELDTAGILSYLNGLNQTAGLGFNAAQGSNLNRLASASIESPFANQIGSNVIGSAINSGNAEMNRTAAMTRGLSQGAGVLGDQLGTAWNNYLKSPTNPSSWATSMVPANNYSGYSPPPTNNYGTTDLDWSHLAGGTAWGNYM